MMVVEVLNPLAIGFVVVLLLVLFPKNDQGDFERLLCLGAWSCIGNGIEWFIGGNTGVYPGCFSSSLVLFFHSVLTVRNFRDIDSLLSSSSKVNSTSTNSDTKPDCCSIERRI